MIDTRTNHHMADWLEQAWLSRYLDGQLSEAETEWFEAYSLDKPEILALMDADSTLRDGMNLLHEASAAELESAGDPPSLPPTLLSRPTRALPPWVHWAAAACVCVGIGWVVDQAGREDPLQLIASPTRVFYDTTRSEVAEPVVFAGDASTPWTLVEVGLGSTEHRAELWVDGELAGSLQASDEGVASFLIHQARLGDAHRREIRLLNSSGEEVRILEFLKPTGDSK